MTNTIRLLKSSSPAISNAVFAQDILDGLSGLKCGTWGKWRYDYVQGGGPASGGHLWENLAANGRDYYVSREGDRALLQSLDFIEGEMGVMPDWIVDLGVGVLRPAKRALLKALGQQATYMPVDISNHFLEDAEQLAHDGTVRAVMPSHADFTRDNLCDGLKGKKLFVLLGSNLGNLPGAPGEDPTAEAVQFLAQIKKSMSPGDQLLVVTDGNQDGMSVVKCYDDVLAHPFILSVIHKIKSDLNPQGDFDPNAWRVKLTWNEKTSQCSHLNVACRDQYFWIGKRSFHIPAGTAYTASNSYKFTQEVLHTIMQKAGLSVTINKMTGNPMIVALARFA